MDMAKRKELTPEEKTWAENLRRIWERKKNAQRRLALTRSGAIDWCARGPCLQCYRYSCRIRKYPAINSLNINPLTTKQS